MKSITTAVIVFTMALTTWAQSTLAQEAAAKPGPVEAFYCILQPGKSMKDLMQVAESFNKWADRALPASGM
jgi:hypothetical protein